MSREEIAERYDDPDILFADGLDDAIIGVEYGSNRVVYSIEKCIECMIDEEMSREEAVEYLEFNTFCAYVGERTPIWVYTDEA